MKDHICLQIRRIFAIIKLSAILPQAKDRLKIIANGLSISYFSNLIALVSMFSYPVLKFNMIAKISPSVVGFKNIYLWSFPSYETCIFWLRWYFITWLLWNCEEILINIICYIVITCGISVLIFELVFILFWFLFVYLVVYSLPLYI